MKNKSSKGLDFPASEPTPLKRLRQLVSAMTMAEKNAFKHYIRNYRDNNRDSGYIRLYDCVNDCLTEDERMSRKKSRSALPHEKEKTFYQKFKSRNAKRAVCKPEELGKKANYLFDKMLESQRGINTYSSKRRDLYAYMLDVQFLFAKEIWEECLSKVRKALSVATELEALPQLLELLHYKRRVLAQLGRDNLETSLRDIYALEQKYLTQIQLTIFFNDLRSEIVLLQWKQGRLEEEEVLRSKINFFLKYASDKKLFDDTFDLNFYYHSIMAGLIRLDTQNPTRFLEFLNHQGFETSMMHQKAIIDLYKRYPERKKENFGRYLGDLSNYLSIAYSLKEKVVELDDFKEDLEKIKPNDPNFLFYVVYFTLLDSIKGRDLLKAKTFLMEKQIWERTGSLGSHVPASRLQVIRHLAGTIFFVREEFTEADRWFRANLDDERNVKNAEAMAASELYHLLVRFELGSTAGVAQKKIYLEPLNRRLGEPENQNRFEGLLLHVLKEILKAGRDSDKLKPVCTAYLPLLKEKLAEKTNPGHFHLFIGWLESKSTGKSLRVSVEPYL